MTPELDTFELDWRKAAMSASQTNEDIEKAFLDSAYSAISNKASPIMRAPYRVGFEIVFKNDDNTRLVGVFVFRVGKELYYAPVFFLNGTIKGTELFYRVSAKRFVPMTNEWVEYLISLNTTSEGHGIPISERGKARNQFNLYQIIDPPNSFNSRKFASDRAATLDPEETHQLIGEFVEHMKSAAAADLMDGVGGESILRKFIVEDGREDALLKLAQACQKNPRFAEALYMLSEPSHYLPELPEIAETKQAAAPTEMLVLHTGLLYNENVKQASVSARDIEKGYKFEDFRKESDVNAVVFADAHQEFQSPNEPGVYKIMLNDGSVHEMAVGYFKHLNLTGDCPVSVTESSGQASYEPRSKSQELCMVDLENKVSDNFNSEFKKPMGQFVRSLQGNKGGAPDDEKELGIAKPSSGKAYRIWNTKTDTFSEPFYVTSVSEKDGVTKAVISGGWHLSNTDQIIINPDWNGEADEQEKIFGKHCRFVEVASKKSSGRECCREVVFECDLNLAHKHALDRVIFENGYKRASVRKHNESWLVSLDGKRQELSKLAATTFLMTRCDLTESAAEDVMAQAASGPCIFLFEPKLTKSAMNIRFNQWPEFYENVNSDYNVLQEPYSHWMIRADSDRPVVERNRVGDKYSGGSANQDSGSQDGGAGQDMAMESPLAIYQASKERGVGKMFEHGVVGSLVNTYDSLSMIDKYLPDLEQALDRMGRILFLFYWKPEDFVKGFGSDDQGTLENKLVSCFRSFGDLVLELVKKNSQLQQGSDSMS